MSTNTMRMKCRDDDDAPPLPQTEDARQRRWRHQRRQRRRRRLHCCTTPVAVAVAVITIVVILICCSRDYFASGFSSSCRNLRTPPRVVGVASSSVVALRLRSSSSSEAAAVDVEPPDQQRQRQRQRQWPPPNPPHHGSSNDDQIATTPDDPDHRSKITRDDRTDENSKSDDDDDNDNDNGEDHQHQVHDWLLQSTSLILGEEATMKLIHGGGSSGDDDDDDVEEDYCHVVGQTSLLCTAQEEKFIINHAESVMRAWCQWISRCCCTSATNAATAGGGGARVGIDIDDDEVVEGAVVDMDVVVRCSPMDAAGIVDAILNGVIVAVAGTAIDDGDESDAPTTAPEGEGADDDDGQSGGAGGSLIGAVELEIKLFELVNVAIDAWSSSIGGGGGRRSGRSGGRGGEEAVRRARGWLRFLQQRLNRPKKEGGDLLLSSSEALPLPDGTSLGDTVARLYEESHRGVVRACIRTRKRKYLDVAIELLEDLAANIAQKNATTTLIADSSAVGSVMMMIRPTTQTYNLILYGLANCDPCSENARRAEELLREMVDSGHDACVPDSNTLRQVVVAWTKSGFDDPSYENARRVLDRTLADLPELDPDASTFNALMTSCLERRNPNEALALFDVLASYMHRSGRRRSDIARPDIYSVNLMLRAMTRQTATRSSSPSATMEAAEDLLEGGIEELYHVRPDKRSYNIVMDAWAKSDLHDAGTRAELLLDRMEDGGIVADEYTFTSAINAIERCSRRHGGSARGTWAEKVFCRMEEMHSRGLAESPPTTPVHNALLNALVSSGEVGAVDRAESLFARMEASGLANTRTFNTMLKGYCAFSRSRIDGRVASFSRPRKAEELLDRMELLSSYHHNGGTAGTGTGTKSDIVADKYSYTTVISGYGRSNAKRKAAEASLILHRMIDSYLDGNSKAKPGTYAFNAALNACAHTRAPEERLEAFTILCSTLILLRDWAKPDHTTYGTFLQACARLLPRDEARKWRVVEAVFGSCVNEGQCGANVLRNLQGIASPELYEALVGRFLTDDGLDIPMRWKRNVAGSDDGPDQATYNFHPDKTSS